jgi:heat shock protein HslJ
MAGMRDRAVPAFAAVLVLGALAGCGDSGDTSGDSPTTTADESPMAVDAAALDGATYESTSVEGHDLVEGSTIELGFEDGTMSVSAGCNTMFGPYDVTDGTLAWTGAPASSMMACAAELEEQDQWLTDLFTSGVQATGDGAALALTDGAVTIELADTSAPPLDTLIGKAWTVVGTIADGATARLPVHTRRPWLTVAADGNTRVFTGCHSGRTSVRIVDDQIAFGKTNVPRGRCRGPARLNEEAVLAVIDHKTTDYAHFDGNILIAIVGDKGLVFQIR